MHFDIYIKEHLLDYYFSTGFETLKNIFSHKFKVRIKYAVFIHVCLSSKIWNTRYYNL